MDVEGLSVICFICELMGFWTMHTIDLQISTTKKVFTKATQFYKYIKRYKNEEGETRFKLLLVI